MPSVNRLLPLLRVGIFGTVSLFAVIVLGLSAHVLSSFAGQLDFAGLGVASSVLTLLTLPVMLFISRVRSGALPSFIAVELSWTGFLWVMWLATGGSTASIVCIPLTAQPMPGEGSTPCNAIEAFGFLNWLMLMGYFIALLGFSIRAVQFGNSRIWTTTVNEADFEGGSNPNYVHDKSNVTQQPAPPSQYPPMGT